jgi:O-antigen ligase
LISPVKDRFTNYNDYHVRLGLAHYSFEMIKDYPIIGSGFSIDTFKDPKFFNPEEYMARIPEKYRKQPHGFFWPHNMLLSIGIRVGLVGLALFLYILFVPAKMCWRLIRFGKDESIRSWGFCVSSIFIMFSAKGLFDPIFTHFADTIFYTILAMITILWRINEEDFRPVSKT